MEEEGPWRALSCAPVNKCRSPVRVVFVCSQLSYKAVDHCCCLKLSANPTPCSIMSLSPDCHLCMKLSPLPCFKTIHFGSFSTVLEQPCKFIRAHSPPPPRLRGWMWPRTSLD